MGMCYSKHQIKKIKKLPIESANIQCLHNDSTPKITVQPANALGASKSIKSISLASLPYARNLLSTSASLSPPSLPTTPNPPSNANTPNVSSMHNTSTPNTTNSQASIFLKPPSTDGPSNSPDKSTPKDSSYASSQTKSKAETLTSGSGLTTRLKLWGEQTLGHVEQTAKSINLLQDISKKELSALTANIPSLALKDFEKKKLENMDCREQKLFVELTDKESVIKIQKQREAVLKKLSR